MTPAALLFNMRRRDVALSANGERLHVEAPAGAVGAEDRALLAEHKPALLRLLAAEDTLARVRACGCDLLPAGVGVRCVGDVAGVPEELRAEVRARQGELAELLRASQPAAVGDCHQTPAGPQLAHVPTAPAVEARPLSAADVLQALAADVHQAADVPTACPCGRPVFGYAPRGAPYCEEHRAAVEAGRCPLCLRILPIGQERCPGACELRPAASARDYPAPIGLGEWPAPAPAREEART